MNIILKNIVLIGRVSLGLSVLMKAARLDEMKWKIQGTGIVVIRWRWQRIDRPK